MFDSILENMFVMVLTIVFLVGGGYLFLVLLDWGIKLKSRNSEQVGLSDLWVESQAEAASQKQNDSRAESRN